MKVLITTDWYKPVINGVVTSVISLLDGLTALGADVRILTLSKDLHSYKEGNVTYIGSIGVGKIYPNARLKAVPSSKYIQDLIEWHPDIVHSQCEFSTFFLAKKLQKLVLVRWFIRTILSTKSLPIIFLPAFGLADIWLLHFPNVFLRKRIL